MAPNAKHVALVGSFNDWDKSATPMQKQYDGTWELRLSEDELWKNVPQDGYPTYKYAVWGADDLWRMKADPFGFFSQLRPNNASRLIDLDNYHWSEPGLDGPPGMISTPTSAPSTSTRSTSAPGGAIRTAPCTVTGSLPTK